MFRRNTPKIVQESQEAALEAGKHWMHSCLITVSTIMLALTPVQTPAGRDSDIMEAIDPSFGCITVVIISVFVAPVLYCAIQEWYVRN